MTIKPLKNKILRIIPERSFLMGMIKKAYSVFLFLQYRFAGLKYKFLLKKREIRFITNYLKGGMIFLGIGSRNKMLGLSNVLRKKNVKVYVYGFSKKEKFNFNNFLDKNSLKQIDLIKVDINGREIEFFKSAEKLFFSNNAPVILYNSSGNNTKKFNYHPVEIMWLLQDFGYSFFTLDAESGKIIPRKPVEYNGIIVAIKQENPSHKLIANGL